MPVADEPILPLNEFQRVMIGWDRVQPFVGIDVIEVRHPVDIERLRRAVEDELAILGVGYPAAEGRMVRYRARGPAVPVESVYPAAELLPLHALEEHCSRELNRRFRTEDPLICVWAIHSSPAFIGMTWQHWPIDGVSGEHLFRRILARYVGAPVADDVTATSLVPPAPGVPSPPWSGRRGLAITVAEIAREMFAFSRVFPVPRPTQGTLRVRLIELPQPVRPAGATLNDVVAAALLGALAAVLPERYRRGWRRRISLVNFVDLRAYAGTKLAAVWGQFLAYAILHLPEPRPTRWGELINAVRRQVMRIRAGQLFFVSLQSFRTIRLAWAWTPARWRWSLPYQLTPFTAALTNTRFRAEWNTPTFRNNFGRSWRVAPLGCLVPLTADICSKGEQVSLAMTYEEHGAMSTKLDALVDTMTELMSTHVNLT
jgi:hypothetical protein